MNDIADAYTTCRAMIAYHSLPVPGALEGLNAHGEIIGRWWRENGVLPAPLQWAGPKYCQYKFGKRLLRFDPGGRTVSEVPL